MAETWTYLYNHPTDNLKLIGSGDGVEFIRHRIARPSIRKRFTIDRREFDMTITRVAILALLLGTFSSAVSIHAEGLDDLIAPGAKVEKLAGDFIFTEGPATDKDGNGSFSDVRNSRTHVWSVDGTLSTFRENTGSGNGLYFDSGGNLLTCEGGARRVTSVDMDGNVTVLADSFGGKKLNSPNDLWIDAKGGVYFTDPRYGNRDGLEQDGENVYYLTPDRKELRLAADGFERPNGICGMADGKTLFVADLGANKTYTYSIGSDGSLSDKKLFAEQGSDGMTIDERGNVYLTRLGVFVFDPDGKQLGAISVPEIPANVRFGGKDGKTLFITARTSLYALRMQVGGQ